MFVQRVTSIFLCLSKKGGGGLPKNTETRKMRKSNAKQACFCLSYVPDKLLL